MVAQRGFAASDQLSAVSFCMRVVSIRLISGFLGEACRHREPEGDGGLGLTIPPENRRGRQRFSCLVMQASACRVGSPADALSGSHLDSMSRQGAETAA